ncbi:MAG: hypothetical protein HY242_11645 [Afipia sp.]|nr:hypothetical protein [Afipia sp.]
MNHSLKSADGGTHIKIVAVSLAVSSLSLLALSAARLHDIGVSEIVSKPAVYMAVKPTPAIQVAEAATFVGWTRNAWQPDQTTQNQ